VTRTLDVRGALDAIAYVPLAALTTHGINERVVAANAIRGQGWFIAAFARWLHRHRISAPFYEIDPMPALQGSAVRLIQVPPTQPLHAGGEWR
jgi:hypothetical protein